MPRGESSTSQVCTLPELSGSACGGLLLAGMLQLLCLSATSQVDLPLECHWCSTLGGLAPATVAVKLLRRVVSHTNTVLSCPGSSPDE